MLDNKHNFGRNEAEFRVFRLGGRWVMVGVCNEGIVLQQTYNCQ